MYRAGGRDLVRVAEVGEKVELDCPEQSQNGGCTWEKEGRDGIACCYGINCQVAKEKKEKEFITLLLLVLLYLLYHPAASM